jgi:hypothetical protein
MRLDFETGIERYKVGTSVADSRQRLMGNYGYQETPLTLTILTKGPFGKSRNRFGRVVILEE